MRLRTCVQTAYRTIVLIAIERRASSSQQGVALTGRNTTGPPCGVTVEL